MIFFVLVFVYFMIDDCIEVEINLVDLEWDIFCVFGVGGQYVNKMEFVVWVCYLLLGVVVECQQECFQYMNCEKVMQMFKSCFYEFEF